MKSGIDSNPPFTIAFSRNNPWITIKFCVLFLVIAGFVSYNFGGMTFGIPLAAAVTILAVMNWNIFDAASNAFLDIQGGDDAMVMARKTVAVTARRVLYASIDYGLTALSIGLVVAMKKVDFQYLENVAISWLGINLQPMVMGFDFRFIVAMATMWLILDLVPVLLAIALFEQTGHDITLGRSYRRMANVIYAHSKKAGVVVFLYEIIIASFWSGPDYTVLFFRDELKTWTLLISAAVAITTVHAILWTTVYWYGFDNIMELAGMIF